MGSESHGISAEVLPLINKPITIPAFGNAESLNVAIATGILCSEAKRRDF
jgi:TrmH family RNA methyltransferase